ncbi:MAG: proline dehydrogenase family protein [Chitinophagales bacterium]|nr:proline dehydrogenase family protein [Chitinophagaceae bacterium]MCB9063624.1 proline dehydrogenase family protein [Chitinophagales bacterium]
MLPGFDNTKVAFGYRTDAELKKAQFLFSTMSSPNIVNIGIAMTKLAIGWRLPIKGIVKKTIFKQFCGGETMEDAAATADMIGKYNVKVILDYGVEGMEGESAFDSAVPEFVKAIKYASTQPNIPFISLKVTGFSRFALLEKLHAGTQLSDTEQEEWARVRNRIDIICRTAAEQGVMVLIDAEETWIQNPVNDLANAAMEKYNQGRAYIFNTFQLYTTGALPYLKKSYEAAIEKGYILGAKLVRGAYMEKERNRASERGYPSPIQPNKPATDKDYDEALMFCMEHLDNLAVFIGTHNENSCMLAAKYMHEHNMNASTERVWFSQLYGMSDNISFNLADRGYNVAKYLPYGPVRDVLPYLMRRAQENTSVAGQTGRELSLINKELKRRKENR